MSQKHTWIKGTIILTLAGLISKVFGMIYRVPLQNIAGDEGLYVYQQIYPLLSIALMLSLYSFPSAISGFVEKKNVNHQIKIQSMMPIFSILFTIGFVLFLTIFSLSQPLAHLIGDESLTHLIRIASVMFLLIPFSALYRGYFLGLNQANYVAISQIIEQIVRVSLIICFTVLVVRHDWTNYRLGSLAAIGTLAGTALTIVFLLFAFRLYKKRYRLQFQSFITNNKLIRAIVTGSIVFSLTYLLHVLLQFIDVFTMIKQLESYRFTFQEAKIEKGIYDRGHAIIQLGLVFGSSLALALVPSIEKEKKSNDDSNEKLAFHLTFTLSLAATVGLIVIMPLLNQLLYENREGTSALQLMMLLVFLLSLVILFSTFLKRYQYRLRQLIWIGGMVLLKILFNLWFIPIYGIFGASLASVLAVSLLLLVFVIKWLSLSKQSFDTRLIFKVIFSSLLMGVIVYLTTEWVSELAIVQNRIILIFIVLLLCLLGVLIFIGLIFNLKVFSKNDMEKLFKNKFN